MEIKDIVLNQSFTAILGWEDSQSSDTVTYSIVKSDGTSFATGSATWVSSGLWKVSFTPLTDAETYIVILNNTTLGTLRSAAYRATQRPQVVTVEVAGTTAADMLTAVNAAIMGILNGGGTKQYMINGRSVTYESLGELRQLRSALKAEIANTGNGNDHFTFAQFED